MKPKRPPLFERLRTGLEDLREYARGERELVETELTAPEPPRFYAAADVTALRNQLGLSQSRLALLMHVSIKTIQSWEQGVRAPSGVASRLLQVLEAPEAFVDLIPRARPKRRSVAG